MLDATLPLRSGRATLTIIVMRFQEIPEGIENAGQTIVSIVDESKARAVGVNYLDQFGIRITVGSDHTQTVTHGSHYAGGVDCN